MQKIAILLMVLVSTTCVTSRWLPTRDNSDRLDKLRDMLRDILESEYERSVYHTSPVFKREVGPSIDAPSPAGITAFGGPTTQKEH